MSLKDEQESTKKKPEKVGANVVIHELVVYSEGIF